MGCNWMILFGLEQDMEELRDLLGDKPWWNGRPIYILHMKCSDTLRRIYCGGLCPARPNRGTNSIGRLERSI